MACDRGIVLCVNDRHDKNPYVPEYYVCKPTTKEFTKISNPKTKFFTQKIAIVVTRASPLKYKIIRVSKQQKSCSCRRYQSLPCEVYDSGLGVWKRLADIKLPYDHIFGPQKPIIVGEEVVWFSGESFFVFDSFNETWEIRSLSIPEAPGRMQLTKHEGKLCMLQESHNNDELVDVIVWIMENREWRKKMKLCLQKPYLGFLVGMKSSDVAVVADCSKMIFYNFCSGSRRDVKAENIGYGDVFFFWSDFEPCNLVNFNS